MLQSSHPTQRTSLQPSPGECESGLRLIMFTSNRKAFP